MLVDSISDLAAQPLFFRLKNVLTHAPVNLKIEALNLAGSIKLKTARQVVNDLEARGILKPGSKVIESSSGNLGVALAFLCAERGYHFTCISDPNILPAAVRLISSLGGQVIVVRERDAQNGYLKTRLDLIHRMTSDDPTLIWTNQYANPSNARAHYLSTGSEILSEFPDPDWVFIGAGTTGTLAGTSRYLRERSPDTRIVAVDSVGSVTFGGPPGTRHLPGLGTSLRPGLANDCSLDRLVFVPEEDSIRMCRSLAKSEGILLGPSTGTVLSAVSMLSNEICASDTVVAISPDFGDRYLETLYNDDWVRERFPDTIGSQQAATVAQA